MTSILFDVVVGYDPVLLHCAEIDGVQAVCRHAHPRCRMSILLRTKDDHVPNSVTFTSPRAIIYVDALPASEYGWLRALTGDPHASVVLCLDYDTFIRAVPMLPPTWFTNQTLFVDLPPSLSAPEQDRCQTWMQSAGMRRLVAHYSQEETLQPFVADCVRELFCSCAYQLFPALLAQRQDWEVLGATIIGLNSVECLRPLANCRNLRMLLITDAMIYQPWPLLYPVIRATPSMASMKFLYGSLRYGVCVYGNAALDKGDSHGLLAHCIQFVQAPHELEGLGVARFVHTRVSAWPNEGTRYPAVETVCVDHERHNSFQLPPLPENYARYWSQLNQFFPNLRMLELMRQQMTDQCLEGVGCLDHLEDLRLDTKDELDDIPRPVYRLRRLKVLSLRCGDLARVSSDLCRLRHLVVVNICSLYRQLSPAVWQCVYDVVHRNRGRIAVGPQLATLVAWANRKALHLPTELLELI